MGRKKIYENKNKRIAEWTNINCDRIHLKIPKGEKAVIQGFAQQQGVSVTSFIREAVQIHINDIYNKADDELKSSIDKSIKEFKKKQNEKENKAES